MSIITHLESYLGLIDKGWKDPAIGTRLQVVSFKDVPFDGARTYSTLGLSDHVLAIRDRYIRQELIFSAYERFDHDQIASFLGTFAETVAKDHRALDRIVIGPSAPIIRGVLLNSVYITQPSVYNESLAFYDGPEDTRTAVSWVIPIHETEADLVRLHGWETFETALEAQDPDLWDLHRDSIDLGQIRKA
jgi:hypothetical protein